MKRLALIAAFGLLAVGAAPAQGGQMRDDAKSGGMLKAATYKAPPADAPRAAPVRFTSKPLAGKPQPYIYKAPMAVKPLKTW